MRPALHGVTDPDSDCGTNIFALGPSYGIAYDFSDSVSQSIPH
jgi:hypothetical protein